MSPKQVVPNCNVIQSILAIETGIAVERVETLLSINYANYGTGDQMGKREKRESRLRDAWVNN